MKSISVTADLSRIGETLRQYRASRAEKIDTVAKAIGVSRKVISQVENGRYYPLKVSTLLLLCSYFDIQIADILTVGDGH